MLGDFAPSDSVPVWSRNHCASTKITCGPETPEGAPLTNYCAPVDEVARSLRVAFLLDRGSYYSPRASKLRAASCELRVASCGEEKDNNNYNNKTNNNNNINNNNNKTNNNNNINITVQHFKF